MLHFLIENLLRLQTLRWNKDVACPDCFVFFIITIIRIQTKPNVIALCFEHFVTKALLSLNQSYNNICNITRRQLITSFTQTFHHIRVTRLWCTVYAALEGTRMHRESSVLIHQKKNIPLVLKLK